MGQGINARGRRQRRRHTVCQQGVEDGDFRDKIHGNDEQFLVGGFLGDDRRSRNLAPPNPPIVGMAMIGTPGMRHPPTPRNPGQPRR